MDSHLGTLTSRLKRYKSAFWYFYTLAQERGLTLDSSIEQVAAGVLKIASVSLSQARNAYAALLLIPGLDQLRFAPLLRDKKHEWSASAPRYSNFWDPIPVFMALARAPYPTCVEGLRARLILVWRFLGLFRSIDLSRTYRTACTRGDKCFIRVQRKGKRQAGFERVIVLPNEHISPWHVLLDYVCVTAPFTKPGEPVLIGLKPPYAPICANTVTSITKEALLGLGLDLGEDGAHTTRGAFVGFYKYLELPSEVVAELGQWANLEAFGKHYLRLGAVDQAAQRVSALLCAHDLIFVLVPKRRVPYSP